MYNLFGHIQVWRMWRKYYNPNFWNTLKVLFKIDVPYEYWYLCMLYMFGEGAATAVYKWYVKKGLPISYELMDLFRACGVEVVLSNICNSKGGETNEDLGIRGEEPEDEPCE